MYVCVWGVYIRNPSWMVALVTDLGMSVNLAISLILTRCHGRNGGKCAWMTPMHDAQLA